MSNTIKLNNVYKGYVADQDKLLPPQETIKRLKEKLKSIDYDILSYTKRIDNGRLNIPVFFSVCGKDAKALTKTKKQMGKGATEAQAEASAIIELIERYSFFSFQKNSENFITKKYKDIIEPKISFKTIAKSVGDNLIDGDISKKIFENIPFKWTKAYNLTKKEEILIPFDWFFAINEFNGASAGNCIEEALIQGICEIVERHTSALISSKKIKVPAIKKSSAKDKAVIDILEKYKKAGVNLYISDFTLDTGIPSVGIIAHDPSTFPEKSEIVWTAGTCTSPEKALSRALTETAQLGGDFNTGSNYLASGLPKLSNLNDADFITSPDITKNISELPNLSDNNMKIEVENLLLALENRGYEVIVVNTAHHLLNTPAFYTIIPGALFRERAENSSVIMFCAKHIITNMPSEEALELLLDIDNRITAYYIKFYIGQSYLALNEYEKAYQYFQDALNLNPPKQDMASILSYAGVSLKENGKYQEAIELLKKGAAIDNERTDIYNLMGTCYFKQKQYNDAIDCFKKVIELDHSSAIDYANIGSCYRGIGDIEKAIEYYETALQIDPTIDFALVNLLKLKN